ncbi:serine/threonine-protein phosphatase [Streptomyces samsunensis]|uniref:PPM-type phosphatase domain-containing protein n=3 Tax=Streptomyces TaxID=1883 RepID=A0A2J7Z052_STRMQ|nr:MULTISPECIES: PP2C family protein-serine/threonine phosphatase [Streptomyces]MYU10810.1 SpoIIE family protein phosphatase [Streptomyces sp. SID8361]AUA12006.1 Phosphoserine phosphatase RsbU [Streptomyces sp. M56]MCM3810207.1 serine/threonine-protein phosphatase [Streptomyces sp. DR7-3]MCQ6250398.1 serine/threonine-protein phosphatase [Streptomyces malaysiensis]NUH38318.1 serine/threonine-protein phosphatase [Streptomyces samsunensis]
MTTRNLTCATTAGLSRAVRALAREHALDPAVRARLVLSAAEAAGAALRAGRETVLEWAYDPDEGLLTVVLRTPGDTGPSAADLPMAPDAVTGEEVVWRLPAAPPASTAVVTAVDATEEAPGDEALAAEELRAVVAAADALTAEHRRLNDELAETNSGVLALYVQLDERDKQLRTAHGQTLRELEDALRPPPIEADGLELAVHYAPAGTDAPTGGDLYDWFVLPDGTVHITIVDALGHGVTSTRSALNVTHAVRTLALEGHRLQSIVARTDEILRPFDRSVMATVQLARIDPATGELWLANGSHPPALLLRRDGAARYLEARGRGIGFPLPGSETPLTERLAPGDLLLLYTDGLTESRRDPIEGEKRLVEAAHKHLQSPIEEVPGAIAEEMHTVILHPDDTLALAVRLTGQ